MKIRGSSIVYVRYCKSNTNCKSYTIVYYFLCFSLNLPKLNKSRVIESQRLLKSENVSFGKEDKIREVNIDAVFFLQKTLFSFITISDIVYVILTLFRALFLILSLFSSLLFICVKLEARKMGAQIWSFIHKRCLKHWIFILGHVESLRENMFC